MANPFPYARRRWLALAAFTVWSAAGALAVPVDADVQTSARQHRFVRVTLPDDESATRRDIEVVVGHQPPARVNPEQPIDVPTAGSVSLTFKSSSGLTLTTTATETDRTITLPPLSRQRFVVNDSYGQAIQGAIIGLRGGAGRFVWTTSAKTSVEGTVSILVPRTSSGVVALVEATGFGPRRQEVTLGRDTTTIALEASATVAMLLTDKSRQLEAATVELYNVTGSLSRTVSVVPGHPVTLTRLPGAEYLVKAIVPRHGVRTIGPFEVLSGEYLDLGAIDISPTAALSGQIKDANELPLVGIRVRLTLSDDPLRGVAETRSDEQGRYRFPALIPASYNVELFFKDIGWRTFADDPVTLYEGAEQSHSFRWSESCALSLAFVPETADVTATYSVSLPVTDGATAVAVTGNSVERRFTSVPCRGSVVVQRLDVTTERHSIPIDIGDNRAVIRVLPPRRPTAVRVTLGRQPLAGVAIWAVQRESLETVVKSKMTNVTDESGEALVSLPSTDDLTIYIQTDNVLLEVYGAKFDRVGDVAVLGLPDMHFRGTVIDSSGHPLAGVSFGGAVKLDNPAARLPEQVVTLFKGRTAPDGTFDVVGLAPAKWSIHFNRAGDGFSDSREFDIELSKTDRLTPVTVSFDKR